jgi:hypothetical protein
MTITILGNHGHGFDIEPVHLQIISARAYDLSPTGHAHKLELSAEQMQAIKDGGTVTAQTSAEQSHRHTVVISG